MAEGEPVKLAGNKLGEIWTDGEFVTLSIGFVTVSFNREEFKDLIDLINTSSKGVK